MPTLVETIRPPLREHIEAMAGVNIVWRDAPRGFAGRAGVPDGETTGVGGLQGTLKINAIDTEGEDTYAIRELDAPTAEVPTGVEFVTQGSRIVVVSLRLWSWSQKDEYHPHGYTERIRSRLENADNASRKALVDLCIVPMEILTPPTTLDQIVDRRITPVSFMDIRFRTDPEELTEVGGIIETVNVSGTYLGQNTHLYTESGELLETEDGQILELD